MLGMDVLSTIRAELATPYQSKARADFAFVKIGSCDLLALWFQLERVSSSGSGAENDSFAIDVKRIYGFSLRNQGGKKIVMALIEWQVFP